MMKSTISRRGLLIGGGALVGTAAAPAAASAEGPDERFPVYTWTDSASLNGWPIRPALNEQAVEGSADLTMTTAQDTAEAILSYVVRKYLYEIDWKLLPTDVIGYRSGREVRADFESNYFSGTAVTIREDVRPLGAFDGLFPMEIRKIEAMLETLEGTVTWGGHLTPSKQSHFEIAVGPDDPAVQQIADRINTERTFINP